MTSWDNCAVASSGRLWGGANNSRFGVGVSTVVYGVFDTSGNNATCSFTVTVQDVTPPTVTCPLPQLKGSDPGQCSAVATFQSATFADNCPSATVSQTAGLITGAVFPVGRTPNRFTATDASGNNASCWFNITVIDVQPPQIGTSLL